MATPSDDEKILISELELGGDSFVVVSMPALSLPETDLSPAELDVAWRFIDGASVAAIAKARGSSPKTVDAQLQRVFQKLGVSSRFELIRLAALHGCS